MKRKLIVLFVLIFIISNYFSMRAFDDYNYANINNYSSSDLQTGYLMINQFNGDENVLFSNFIKLLDKYEINAYLFSTNDTMDQSIIFAHSNDNFYFENILLEEGEISQLKKFTPFSMSDIDANHRFLSFMKLSDISIYPFNLDYEDFHLLSGYTITYNSKTDINDFIGDIKTTDSSLEIVFQEVNGSHGELIDTTFDNYYFYFLVISILIFSFISTIIKNMKKIGIMKQEGYSNLHIYFNFFLKYFLISIPIYIFTFIIFLIILPFDINKLTYFIIQMCIYSFIAYAIAVIISILLLAIILVIPPLQLSKGKSHLNQIYQILIILKCGILLIGLSAIISGFNNVYELTKIQWTTSTQLEKYHNLFQVHGIYIRGDANNPDKQKELNDISEILKEKNRAFSFKVVTIEDQNGKIVYEYFVDQGYLSNYYDKTNELNSDDYTVLLPKKYANELKAIYDYNFKDLYDEIPYKVIDFDFSTAKNYSMDYLSETHLNDFSVISFMESNSISNYYFYFNGSQKEAQEYLDQLFIDHNMKPSYSIIDCTQIYETYKKWDLQRKIPVIIRCVLLILLLLVLDNQLYEICIAKNKKRYLIEQIEGIQFGSAFINLITDNIFVYLICYVLSFIYKNNEFITLWYFYLLIFMIDLIIQVIRFVLNRNLKGGIRL